MKPHVLSQAAELSNRQLLSRVRELVRQEREAIAVLIAHLAVLDERGLYHGEGCASLFTYLTQVLHYSEHAAYNRMEAARAVQRFPAILELLANGSVNLTTVRLLAPALTLENQGTLLEAARRKTTEQVREILASMQPKMPVKTLIRKIAPRKSDLELKLAPLPPLSPAVLVPASSLVSLVVPVAPERYKVQFTASAGTRAKLKQAQDLLRHRIPNGDLGEIIDRALTLLIRDALKKKCGVADRLRTKQGSLDRTRHVPAAIKRVVWERDGGRCAFVAQNGHRCTERAFLEFHHVVPYSTGGPATVDNIQLRCRSHNGFEARQYFGPAQPEPEFKTVRKLGL